MLELSPSTRQLTGLLANIDDDQLRAPTPCPDYTLGDLIDHVNGLTVAFRFAASKQPLPAAGGGPSGDARRLGDDWRDRIPTQLEQLAQAWRDTGAWEGMTAAGGVALPGQVAGLVALNEVVVHGWDISRASGQPFAVDEATVAACLEFVAMSVNDRSPDSALFGPVIEVPDDAAPLERLVGLSGRDPSWRPGR
jgi:uncharacterized protein (TIGR03086 family)